MSASLAEALPAEMARVREVLGHYREIGPAGNIGALFIEMDLREADQAVMSGDVVRMIAIYQTLQGINLTQTPKITSIIYGQNYPVKTPAR